MKNDPELEPKALLLFVFPIFFPNFPQCVSMNEALNALRAANNIFLY
jgi:hypothetical protein